MTQNLLLTPRRSKRVAQEIAYLESGRNGLMVADSEEAFIEGVEHLFKNAELREKMASACMEDASKYSLEKMVENFSNGIVQALQYEPVRKYKR